jgi:hypothetical protein
VTAIRAAVLATTIGILVGFAPSAAHGATPSVSVSKLAYVSLQPGGQATVSFIVSGPPQGAQMAITVSVTSSLSRDVTLSRNGTSCGTSCAIEDTLGPGGSRMYVVALSAARTPTVPAGGTGSGPLTVEAVADSGATAIASGTVTLRVPAAIRPSPTPHVAAATRPTGLVAVVSPPPPVPSNTPSESVAPAGASPSQSATLQPSVNLAGHGSPSSLPGILAAIAGALVVFAAGVVIGRRKARRHPHRV